MQLMFLLMLAAAGGDPSSTAEDPVTVATTAVANQHVAVSVLSAMYYCKNKAWPENVGIVRAFYEESKFPLPVQPDWAILGADGSSYTIDRDTLTVTTAANAVAHAHKVTSTNNPPGCAGRNLDVNAGMHIGE